MRRFVTLAVLLFIAVPFGISIAGCSKATTVTYCNGLGSGVKIGQTVTLDLEPRLTGISINQGAIGSVGSATGRDCKGASSSAVGLIYATSNRSIVDVNPTIGSNGLCAGTWNRNTGTGIADYTVCTPNGNEGVAFITASAQGVSSNQVAVYVHPVVTSVVLGLASTDCTADPASNCFPPDSQTYWAGPGPAPPTIGVPYSGTACLSQGIAAQIAARAYAGVGGAQTNISSLVGPINFTAQNSAVVAISANGLATATQPGSTIINAVIAQSSSTTGAFSTCPPAKIVLSASGSANPPTGPIQVSQNITQALAATVTDSNGQVLNNISLQFVSTTPATVPTSLNDITPTFPGAAAITAVCQPPSCNPSAFDQIGLFGNGTPITSNPVQINASGTNNSTILYIASTKSQYLLPIDFTVSSQSSPVRLPYAPNSMLLSPDGTSLYMGTDNELMVLSTNTESVTRQDISVSGRVLAISPNNSTLVITDPVRKLVYLYGTSGGTVQTEYGGVGTSAQFNPDSSTVYIPTDDGRLLVYSTFTGWSARAITSPASGVAVTIPAAGVYLASNPVDVRSNCPITVANGNAPFQTTTNTFYPEIGPVAGANAANTANPYGLVANNIASTNDGLHELFAAVDPASGAANFEDITTNRKSGACTAAAPGDPVISFSSTPGPAIPLAAGAPTAVTAVLPTSDSAYAFVTYTGAGGVVPEYNPATGVLTNVPLQTTAAGAPGAPIAGVVSSDNQTFYTGTDQDDLVHRLTRGANGFTDTLTPITPLLPNFNGQGSAPPNLLAQKPRKARS